MSKSNTRSGNRPKGKSSQPPAPNLVPWLILAGVLVFFALVFVLSQANNSSGSAGQSTPKVTGAPRIEVSNETIDMGTIKFNNTVDSVFSVRNVGDQDLIVLREPQVEIIEGC